MPFWQTIVISLIAAMPGVIVGIAALRANRATHKSVNSRVDALIQLTDELAEIRGFAAGEESEREKQDEKDRATD